MRGILLVIAATLLFASMDSAGKYLMTKYNVPFVAMVRYAINLVLLVALVAPRHGAKLWQTSRTGLVLLRTGSLSVASLFSGLALQRMPVGETVAILYLQGFGVMLVAGWLLKEKVSVAGWLCAMAGFSGVIFGCAARWCVGDRWCGLCCDCGGGIGDLHFAVTSLGANRKHHGHAFLRCADWGCHLQHHAGI